MNVFDHVAEVFREHAKEEDDALFVDRERRVCCLSSMVCTKYGEN